MLIERGLLEQAVSEPFGIIVSCENASTLRGKLYALKREAKENGNLKYEHLKLKLSPTNPETELWIINGKAEISS